MIMHAKAQKKPRNAGLSLGVYFLRAENIAACSV